MVQVVHMYLLINDLMTVFNPSTSALRRSLPVTKPPPLVQVIPNCLAIAVFRMIEVTPGALINGYRLPWSPLLNVDSVKSKKFQDLHPPFYLGMAYRA